MAVVALVAPGSAVAKGLRYEGTIDQPPVPGEGIAAPTLSFGVKLTKARGRHKPKPTVLFPFNTYNAYYRCDNGKTLWPGARSDVFSTVHTSQDFAIKHRRFRFKDPEYGISGTGRIPKRGPATGTVRLTGDPMAGSDPETGDPVKVHCDSGILHWTAKRK